MTLTEQILKDEVREVAQKIVDLTGFGQVLHVNDIIPDIKKLVESALTRTREECAKEVEGMKYVFEKPKDDYLPEVYKHLKSKNEGYSDAASKIREMK